MPTRYKSPLSSFAEGFSDSFSKGYKPDAADDDKKKQLDAQLFTELISQGFPQDQATYIVSQRNQTGRIDSSIPIYAPLGAEGDRPMPIMDKNTGEVIKRPAGIAPLPPSNAPSHIVPISPSGGVPRSTIQTFDPMGQNVLTGIDASDPSKTITIPIKQGQKNIGTFQYDKPSADKTDEKQAKETARQDKLETQARRSFETSFSARSGGKSAGIEDMKVNSAIHARSLIEASRDPNTGKVDLNQVTTPELAMSLATLISNGNAPSLEQYKNMTPQSLEADIKRNIGYVLGKPVKVLSDNWADQFIHQLDRQATTAEDNRNTYLRQVKLPFGLDDETKTKLLDEYSSKGNSYREIFGIPKTEGGHNGMANKISNKPKTVIQGGHTYTLNEKTGEYE